MTAQPDGQPNREELLRVNRRIRIPLREFSFEFIRSSGPGGQNVNKVSSKVRLHWPVRETPSLPDDVRARFLAKYHRRITTEGELQVTSQRYRDQKRNVDDCLEKLREMLQDVVAPPKPRKTTKPTRASVKRRLDEKRKRAEKKQRRGRPGLEP